jgi:hypothetical protein
MRLIGIIMKIEYFGMSTKSTVHKKFELQKNEEEIMIV